MVRTSKIISIITTNYMLIGSKTVRPEITPVQSHKCSEDAFRRVKHRLILANFVHDFSVILKEMTIKNRQCESIVKKNLYKTI